MPASRAAPRPIRRLRRALVLVGMLTALLIAAACRLEAAGRVMATVGAVACLAIWCGLLNAEGRACDRLEARRYRRTATRAGGRSRVRHGDRRRRAA